MKINTALKTLRIFHELKQKELSKYLKIAPSYISEIEAGKATPSIDTLEKYSNYFEIPISNIFLIAEGKTEILEITVNILNLKESIK